MRKSEISELPKLKNKVRELIQKHNEARKNKVRELIQKHNEADNGDHQNVTKQEQNDFSQKLEDFAKKSIYNNPNITNKQKLEILTFSDNTISPHNMVLW